MIKKHAVLICAAVSVILIVIAVLVYPGGSFVDKNSVGFDWTKNFFSNLFAAKAMNGLENSSRIWAIIGMAFHSVGYGIFFTNMSKKLASKHAAMVLKVIGVANILFSFLIVTPLHDIMVTVSGTLMLLGMFYITVFIFMTKLHVFKGFCILYMLSFYFTMYLYGAGHLGLLAIMQKVTIISSMFLILGLEYFTNLNDFIHIKQGQKMIDTKTKSLLLIFIVVMISCKNQNTASEVPNSEQNEIVPKDTQETEIKEARIDKIKIGEQLQGKWKEIEYPYRTAEFVSSTVKFVEEGTAGKLKFEAYEISESCQFENSNVRDVKSGDIVLALPETRRCEKLRVANDTLTLYGFSTNMNEEYHIIYLKAKEEKG